MTPRSENTMQLPKETADHVADIDSRVTGLEVQFRALDANLRGLAADTKSEFQNVTAAINALGAKLEAGSKTQWPVLIAGGSLILGILTSLGLALWSPVRTDLERMHTEIRALSKDKLDVETSSMWSKLREEQFERRDERDADYKRRIETLEHKVFGF